MIGDRSGLFYKILTSLIIFDYFIWLVCAEMLGTYKLGFIVLNFRGISLRESS